METPNTRPDAPQKFRDFLEVYNRINMGNLVDLDRVFGSLKKKGKDFGDEARRPDAVREGLKMAVERAAPERADQDKLVRFIFSVEDIAAIPAPEYGVPQETGHIDLDQAELLYKAFYSAAKTFFDLITRIEFDGGAPPLFLGLGEMPCEFRLEKNGALSCVPMPERLLYGFTGFGRVRKCPVCNDYFVQDRTDQKYCTKKCKAARDSRDFYEKNRSAILARKKAEHQKKKAAKPQR